MGPDGSWWSCWLLLAVLAVLLVVLVGSCLLSWALVGLWFRAALMLLLALAGSWWLCWPPWWWS